MPYYTGGSPLLVAESAIETNPNCVFLSACLPAYLPD